MSTNSNSSLDKEPLDVVPVVTWQPEITITQGEQRWSSVPVHVEWVSPEAAAKAQQISQEWVANPPKVVSVKVVSATINGKPVEWSTK